jgi:hypothetical protein
MDSILDEEDFQPKIEERANSLFESKDGKPELEVHRTFSTGSGIGVVKNQDVSCVSDLSHLEQVRKQPTPEAKFFTWQGLLIGLFLTL